MFDLVKDILKHIPDYLGDLFRVIMGPRSHICKGIDEDIEDFWTRALSFLLISFVLVCLLEWAIFPGKGDIKQVLVGEGLLELFVLIFQLVILLLVWKMFRANQPPRVLLIPYLFIIGVAMLIEGFAGVTQFAVTKVLDPELWTLVDGMQGVTNLNEMQALANEHSDKLLNPVDPSVREATLNLLKIIQTAAGLVALLWILIAWVVYKDLTGKNAFAVYAALVLVIILDFFNPAEIAKGFILIAMQS